VFLIPILSKPNQISLIHAILDRRKEISGAQIMNENHLGEGALSHFPDMVSGYPVDLVKWLSCRLSYSSVNLYVNLQVEIQNQAH
jgi:hypothetical protein